MKNKIIVLLIGIVVVAGGIYIFSYGNKAKLPLVQADGKIEGKYAVEGIMALNKPYICKFEKSDTSSRIAGTLHINENQMYGEFRVQAESLKEEFNAFLVLRDGKSYTWTSLGNLGYKSTIAKSAIKNASPREQAQIVGTRDLFDYKCEPWLAPDNSVFNAPDWITFTEV